MCRQYRSCDALMKVVSISTDHPATAVVDGFERQFLRLLVGHHLVSVSDIKYVSDISYGAIGDISLSAVEISGIATRMGRPKLNFDKMAGRFPEGTFARMDAVRDESETRTAFVQEAVEREIKRRERLKAD